MLFVNFFPIPDHQFQFFFLVAVAFFEDHATLHSTYKMKQMTPMLHMSVSRLTGS